MGHKYFFQNATCEDIPQILAIEEEFFQKDIAFTEEFLKKWFNYNPNMFYVVKGVKGNVEAFAILVPVTENLYRQLQNGKVHDLSQFSRDEVKNTVKAEYYYIADIAASSRKTGPSIELIRGMIKFLGHNTHWVIATPVTNDGFQLCKTMGFKSGDHDATLGYNYELEITDTLRRKYIKEKEGW